MSVEYHQKLFNPPMKPGDIIAISDFGVSVISATFAVIPYCWFYWYGFFCVIFEWLSKVKSGYLDLSLIAAVI
jgi:hypothetical protein